MKQKHDFAIDALHVFVLASFALAQPLFDLLGRNAEFFVVRRSEPVDIFLLVLVVCILLPGLIVLAEAAAGLFGRRVRKVVHGIAVACFMATITLQALKRMGDIPGTYLMAGAALLGVALAVTYLRFPSLRFYLTVLSPAVLIFPGLFLFHSPVFKVVFPKDNPVVPAAKVNATAPIVMVIFDELPLTSLMDEHHQIDPIRYPNFAALAKDATWFRNATTVGDYTTYAVPPILTGSYPDSTRLPTSVDYPRTLFTLLGSSYRLKVFGPITELCPDNLCERGRKSLAERMRSLLSDLSIVYLHILLPNDLSAELPPVTQNWMNFTRTTDGKAFLKHVMKAANEDRVQDFRELLNSFDSAPEPTLYAAHLEIPHGPFMYFPSGKGYFIDNKIPFGLLPDGKRWSADEWAVVQYYQRHLLQVGYADTLLGELLTNLKKRKLYDPSLIVVTSDHGISFRPNVLLKDVSETNFQDVLPVPLFIKAPYQRAATVSDRNVETIDILPTIADILDIDLPWPTDGISALDSFLPERKTKTVFHLLRAKRRMTIDSTILESTYQAVKRKVALFGSGGDSGRLFNIGPHRDLVGRHVTDVAVRGEASTRSTLDRGALFTSVDLQASLVPAHITGYVENVPSGTRLDLAIAINGTIRATTRTNTHAAFGQTRFWSVLVNEASFRAGRNEIEVFVVRPYGKTLILESSFKMTKPRHYRSLALGGRWVYGVEESGFDDQEWWNGKPVRWTNGHAKLVIPLQEGGQPGSLRVSLASTGPKGTKLEILVDGKELFHQTVPAAAWTETFNLAGFPLKEMMTVELISDTFVPREISKGTADPRTLGVAVGAITLVDSGTPLSAEPLSSQGYSSDLRLVGNSKNDTFAAGQALTVYVANNGKDTWPTMEDLAQWRGSVRLGILWFVLDQPGRRVAEHRADLPHTMLQGEKAEVDVELNPISYEGKRLPSGDYEVWIGLVHEGITWFYNKNDKVLKVRVNVD